MGYTKLFGCIVASTIWREDNATRLVWITMLAMKNERHIVEASLPGLADLARVSFEDCEKAVAKLESPDKYSRNQDHDGRRIEKVQGGWLILNGEYYRKQMSLEERREYQRLYHRQYRAKKNQEGQPKEQINRLQNLQPWQLNLDIERVKRLLADEQDRRNSNPELCRSYYADLEALKAEKRRRAPPRKTTPKPVQKVEPRNGNVVTAKSLEELAKLKQAVT